MYYDKVCTLSKCIILQRGFVNNTMNPPPSSHHLFEKQIRTPEKGNSILLQ